MCLWYGISWSEFKTEFCTEPVNIAVLKAIKRVIFHFLSTLLRPKLSPIQTHIYGLHFPSLIS